jgi:hypothetical protein
MQQANQEFYQRGGVSGRVEVAIGQIGSGSGLGGSGWVR